MPRSASSIRHNVEFQANACVEDVAVKLLDERTILKQVTLLLYAVPKQS